MPLTGIFVLPLHTLFIVGSMVVDHSFNYCAVSQSLLTWLNRCVGRGEAAAGIRTDACMYGAVAPLSSVLNDQAP